MPVVNAFTRHSRQNFADYGPFKAPKWPFGVNPLSLVEALIQGDLELEINHGQRWQTQF